MTDFTKNLNALTERLNTFSDWLATRPNRVRCSVCAEDGSISVRLHRSSKGWRMEIADKDKDWVPVCESSTPSRVKAVYLLDRLYDEMLKTQKRYADEADAACQQFDMTAGRLMESSTADPKSPREAFKGSHRNEVDIEASAIARDVTREVMRGIAKDFGTNVAGATQ